MLGQFLLLLAQPPALRSVVKYLCMWREAVLQFETGSKGWYCIHLTVWEEFRSAEWNNPTWHLSKANGLASQVTESVLSCKATNNLICHSWIDDCNVSDLCLCTARTLKRDFLKKLAFKVPYQISLLLFLEKGLNQGNGNCPACNRKFFPLF